MVEGYIPNRDALGRYSSRGYIPLPPEAVEMGLRWASGVGQRTAREARRDLKLFLDDARAIREVVEELGLK